jgi:hypothetical protein
MRISEVNNLLFDDVEILGNEIKVQIKKSKTNRTEPFKFFITETRAVYIIKKYISSISFPKNGKFWKQVNFLFFKIKNLLNKCFFKK